MVETKSSAASQALATIAVSVLVGFAIYGALIWAPTELTMGFLQRIFYFHVSSESVGMVAFSIVFIANIAYLTRSKTAMGLAGPGRRGSRPHLYYYGHHRRVDMGQTGLGSVVGLG